MRAIVIDDSKAIRRLLRSMLADLDFEVLEAENGSAAWGQLTETGPVELALVDWNMPVMNGLDFVRMVRANVAYANMRVMMVTTETGADEMSLALAAGADEYVMKPFSRESIVEKLRILGLR